MFNVGLLTMHILFYFAIVLSNIEGSALTMDHIFARINIDFHNSVEMKNTHFVLSLTFHQQYRPWVWPYNQHYSCGTISIC